MGGKSQLQNWELGVTIGMVPASTLLIYMAHARRYHHSMAGMAIANLLAGLRAAGRAQGETTALSPFP